MLLSSRKSSEGNASTPTSFDITFLKLYSNVIKPEKNYNIDIKALVPVIEGMESLYSPSIIYSLSVVDSFNLLEQLKITGGEKIEFGIQQKLKNKTHKYKIECYVSDIVNYIKTGPATASYTIKAVSKQMRNESATMLKRAFNGTPGTLIKKICKSDLEVTPHHINETSSKQVQGIYPRVRPLHAIMWLTRNSYDNGTPFYFYETLRDGLHYKSYKEMLDEDPIDEYVYKSFQKDPVETTAGFEEERLRVRELSSPEYGLSRYADISRGAFGSTLHEIDISTKQYNQITFDAEKNRLQYLNPNKINVNNQNTLIKSRHANELPDAKNFFISKNSKAYNGNNYYSQSDIQMQKAIAQKERLHSQEIRLVITGNYDISVGKKIKLRVMRQKPEIEGSGKDKALSGIYLVTQVHHQFEEGYIMELMIQKDSGELNYETA